MEKYRKAFVGIDVAKMRNAIAIAEAGREGDVRFFGEIERFWLNRSRGFALSGLL